MSSNLNRTIRTILKPLIRLLHRKGIAFGEFNQLARQVYVDVAEESLQQAGERPTTSRIAIVTGLTRKEVASLRQEPAGYKATSHYNRGVRVMTGWLQDSEFTDAQGKAAALPVQGETGSFVALVNRYSGDMPYRAMLQEMERVGVIRVDEQEYVHLLTDGYIPHQDEGEKLAILGQDVAALIATIDHNLLSKEHTEAYFQRKVSYDNLPEEALPGFKNMVNQEGMALLIHLNEWLVKQDRDHNPAVTGTGRKRAGVGIYYFEETLDGPQHKESHDED